MKIDNLEGLRIKTGSLFHSAGPASANALLPSFLSDRVTKNHLQTMNVALVWIGERNRVYQQVKRGMQENSLTRSGIDENNFRLNRSGIDCKNLPEIQKLDSLPLPQYK